MFHWQHVLPEFIHHLSYESLVQKPKEELTKLLGFCSLSFQKACLSFATEHSYIDTLSDVHLRNGLKMNKNTAWLPYQEYLPDCFSDLS